MDQAQLNRITPTQYLRQHPQPSSVRLKDVRHHTGRAGLTADQLSELKRAECVRRFRPGMKRAEYAAALGINPHSLTTTIRRVTGQTFGELSGRTERELHRPGSALDIADLRFYRDGTIATAEQMARESGHRKSSINKLILDALTENRIEEVRPGEYRSRNNLREFLRRAWTGGGREGVVV